MDSQRFDGIRRTLRGGSTRRRMLAGVAGATGLYLGGVVTGRHAAAKPTAVTIETIGAPGENGPSGSFTASGAINDAGTFSSHEDLPQDFTYAGIGAPTFGVVRAVRTFVGQDGTFTLEHHITFSVTDQPGLFAVEGTWAALSGTDDYARLHGQGTISGVIDATTDPERFLFNYTGTVQFA